MRVDRRGKAWRDEAPIRADGRCAVCGKERKKPGPSQGGLYQREWLRDPFCSTECCRRFHSTELDRSEAA